MASSVYCATCGAVNPRDATRCFACGNPPLVAVVPQRRLLNQRYHLLEEIARGGFGAIYRAEDTQLGNRVVAVKKMLQDDLKTNQQKQEAADGFQREANILAGLSHPNLPRIFEQFKEDENWYLVMEFIQGKSLEGYLAGMPDGRLPVNKVLHIALQLADVLDYLHTHQPPIIFRDLKPPNIMLTSQGHIYLIDFGIARLFKPGQAKDTTAFGSEGYAAPEQYGKIPRTTPQSDIYSLGATLHQLLSGADPSDTPFFFTPLSIAHPAGLSSLIMQMLEKDRYKRPASMADIKQQLQVMRDEPSLSKRSGWQTTGSGNSMPQTTSNRLSGAYAPTNYQSASAPTTPARNLPRSSLPPTQRAPRSAPAPTAPPPYQHQRRSVWTKERILGDIVVYICPLIALTGSFLPVVNSQVFFNSFNGYRLDSTAFYAQNLAGWHWLELLGAVMMLVGWPLAFMVHKRFLFLNALGALMGGVFLIYTYSQLDTALPFYAHTFSFLGSGFWVAAVGFILGFATAGSATIRDRGA